MAKIIRWTLGAGALLLSLSACTFGGNSSPDSRPSNAPTSSQLSKMHIQEVTETALPSHANAVMTSGYNYIDSATGSNFHSSIAQVGVLEAVCDSPGPVAFQIGSDTKSNLYTIACDKKVQSERVEIDAGDNVVTIYARNKYADVKWQITSP